MVDRINAVEGDPLCCFPSVRQHCAGAAVLQGLQLSTGRTFASQTELHPYGSLSNAITENNNINPSMGCVIFVFAY